MREGEVEMLFIWHSRRCKFFGVRKLDVVADYFLKKIEKSVGFAEIGC